MPKGTTTPSNDRLKKAWNNFTFNGKINENGNPELLDAELKLKLVIVERFYPNEEEARVHYYSTVNHPDKEPVSVNVQVAKDYIDEDMYVEINPTGKPEKCPKTGRDSIVPPGIVVGFVIAIDGKHNKSGSVMIRYIHIPENGDHVWIPGEIVLKNKESKITIKKDEIDIDTPKLMINGTELVVNENGK